MTDTPTRDADPTLERLPAGHIRSVWAGYRQAKPLIEGVQSLITNLDIDEESACDLVEQMVRAQIRHAMAREAARHDHEKKAELRQSVLDDEKRRLAEDAIDSLIQES